MSPEVHPASLRELAGVALPPDAIEVDRFDGTSALAWRAHGHAAPMTATLFRLPDGLPRMALVSRDFRDARSWLPRWRGHSNFSHDLVVAKTFFVPGPEAVSAFAPRLSGTQASAAASFLSGCPPEDPCEWEWLSDPVQGPSAIAFCREHPWLARTVLLDPGMRARLASGHADDVAIAAARAVGRFGALDDGGAPRAAVEAMRGFAIPACGIWRRQDEHVRAVSRMPRDTWPAPMGGSPSPDDTADMAAFLVMAPLASPPGMPSPLRSFLGMRGRRWARYVAALHARCGLPPAESRNPVDEAVGMALAVKAAVGDMTDAFAREVAMPALMATGIDPRTAAWIAGPGARALLAGDRTLPRLCEIAGTWHVRSASISAFVEGLRGDDGSAGPALFGDVDLGGGLFARCLRTPEELAAEGGSGPDASGVPGLCHCVASYADAVLAGRTCIASIRRRLPDGAYERLSTAEIDYASGDGHSVVQHFGRRNAPPPSEAVEVLPALLAETEAGAWDVLACHRPVPRRSTSLVIHEASAWEAVRDLWSFALTRPQRAMGAAELAAAMRGGAA